MCVCVCVCWGYNANVLLIGIAMTLGSASRSIECVKYTDCLLLLSLIELG